MAKTFKNNGTGGKQGDFPFISISKRFVGVISSAKTAAEQSSSQLT